MSHEAILARMRKARVPQYAYATSLDKERQSALSAMVQGKEYTRGVGGLASYVLRSSGRTVDGKKVAKIAAVVAKELVLQKVEVVCLTLHSLSRLNSDEDALEAQGVYVGRGYLVVCDIGENAAPYPELEWQAMQSFLASHVSRGGGIILGITAAEPRAWTFDMELLIDSFASMAVV